jgi:molecular chaperone GrpE
MERMKNPDERDTAAPDRTLTAAGDGLELEERVRALETALEAAREETRQAHEKWVRERADLENVKRRATRERADLAKFANEALLRDLLPVVDNLERAAASAEEDAGREGGPLLAGVKLVLKSLVETLERHGLTRVRARGAQFDPAEHEAMAQVESAVHEPNAVVDEHQAGYRLHDRLLRPALVTVAKAPPPDDDLAKGSRGT